MATMYDSVTASAIPRSAEIVAGYIDGNYAWSDSDWALFPDAEHVRIAVLTSTNDGSVLDCEPGNSVPADVPAWLRMRRDAGLTGATVYTMRSWWNDIKQACDAAGEAQPHFWIADWDNDPTVPDGAVVKQYANPSMHGRGHYDLNETVDSWPGDDGASNGDTPPTPRNAKQNAVHRVVRGDTLSEIGAQYGVSWQRLAEVNNLANPNVIYPGQNIRIPSGNSRRYRVKSGDTLWDIGNMFNVGWQRVARANGISESYTIYPGDTLVIPS